MNKTVGQRCKIARESAGFTQDQAAKLLKLTPRRLRDYESSSNNKVSVVTYQAMAYIYEVSLNWLLLGVEPMELDSPVSSWVLVWQSIPESIQPMLWDLLVGLSSHKPTSKDPLARESELAPEGV